jgi:4-amino-4-deoxy-L-arabinose transferase-like glycosyltransferase
MSGRIRPVGIIAIVLLGIGALALRVWGAGWSLPYVDHPDEPAVVDVILRVTQGELNTEHFFYPSLILYLQALVFTLHFQVGLATGLYSAPLVVPESNHFYTTIPQAFVWARIFTALLGTATVLALATWSARFVGRGAALIAGVLLALSPWAIVHSHYITVDGPAGLFALLAVLASLQVLRSGRWRDYLLAGVLVGLATGAKYQNALVVVPLLLAHALHWRQAALIHSGLLIGAGALAASTFLLTSPFIVLDFPGFMRDMETLFGSYGAGVGDIGRAWPVDAYLRFFFRELLLPLPFLLALVGAVVLGRRDWPLLLVLLAFPLLMILGLLRLETHFYRNLLPAQAPLLLLAGVGAAALWEALARRLPPRFQLPVLLAALALLFGPPAVDAVRASMRLAQPDTRVVAQEWARRAYPGVQIAGELSHPLRWDGVAQASYHHYLPLHNAEWYREQGYGLLLANAGRRGRDRWTDDYTPLLEAGDIVYTVGGRASGYLGPRIDIIDLGLRAADLSPAAIEARLGPLRLLDVRFGRRVNDPTGPDLRPDVALRPGDILAVTAFWQTPVAAPPGTYATFLHLRTPDGHIMAQRDALIWQGLFAPTDWPPDALMTESLDMPLPDTLPPGDYRLVLGLYDPVSGARYTATNATGEPYPDNEIMLGPVQIVAE